MDFEDYTRSLDCVTMLGRPESERIVAAYLAGSGGKTPPASLAIGARGRYLWDSIRNAFAMGQERR